MYLLLELYLNDKACPNLILSTFHHPLQDIQPKAPYFVCYLKKETMFLTKYLQQKTDIAVRGIEHLRLSKELKETFFHMSFTYLNKHLARCTKVFN